MTHRHSRPYTVSSPTTAALAWCTAANRTRTASIWPAWRTIWPVTRLLRLDTLSPGNGSGQLPDLTLHHGAGRIVSGMTQDHVARWGKAGALYDLVASIAFVT